MRAALMKAGELLTAEEAERRVLIIENPGLKGQSRITGSLFAGLQLLLPGERASAHRHVAAALRFILEGSTAYTAVDGERTLMRPGDFVLTPNWTWHDHGNDGEEPVIWLDGLDMHMVNFFGASFSENYPEKEFPLARPAGDSELRYGGTMLPEGDRAAAAHSPLLNYRYDRARENLAELAAYSGPDPVHGYKLRYVNPQTGGAPMPTISAALQLLPKGFQTSEYRATDATIFAVAEGEGTSKIGEFSFDWGKNDIFVVPSWQPVTHRALTEAVLFSFSDRAAQEALGLWREKRNLRNAE
jgi:gentisate 1,2-dioxygenase